MRVFNEVEKYSNNNKWFEFLNWNNSPLSIT
jgi:hypothetical protein